MAYTTFDWSTIRARLRARVEDKPWWEGDEDRSAFNEALLVWNLLTGYWKRRETLATVADQSVYTLSASMLYRTRITFNNLPLTSSSREDLNRSRYQWRGDTTLTGRPVPSRPMVFAPISLRTFYLWPKDAVGSNLLTIDGVAATPTIVEDGDTIDAGEELLTTLLGYSLHALTFKKGGPAFQSTLPLFQTFLHEAAEVNDQIKTGSVYRRIMGLDRRDLKPLRGMTTLIDQIAQRTS